MQEEERRVEVDRAKVAKVLGGAQQLREAIRRGHPELTTFITGARLRTEKKSGAGGSGGRRFLIVGDELTVGTTQSLIDRYLVGHYAGPLVSN